MNAHRVPRTNTTALPACPGCKQSATAIYNKQLGCRRCGTLTPRPRVRLPVPNYLNPTSELEEAGGHGAQGEPATGGEDLMKQPLDLSEEQFAELRRAVGVA